MGRRPCPQQEMAEPPREQGAVTAAAAVAEAKAVGAPMAMVVGASMAAAAAVSRGRRR